MMKTRPYFMSVLIWGVSASASAQSSNCEIVLMPLGGSAAEGTFADAEGFLDSVYDGEEGHLSSVADIPIRAVMCERGTLVPSMRDLPILKTGLPLSLSQDFDSNTSGLLTLYDAGKDFKRNILARNCQKMTRKNCVVRLRFLIFKNSLNN